MAHRFLPAPAFLVAAGVASSLYPAGAVLTLSFRLAARPSVLGGADAAASIHRDVRQASTLAFYLRVRDLRFALEAKFLLEVVPSTGPVEFILIWSPHAAAPLVVGVSADNFGIRLQS